MSLYNSTTYRKLIFHPFSLKEVTDLCYASFYSWSSRREGEMLRHTSVFLRSFSPARPSIPAASPLHSVPQCNWAQNSEAVFASEMLHDNIVQNCDKGWLESLRKQNVRVLQNSNVSSFTDSAFQLVTNCLECAHTHGRHSVLLIHWVWIKCQYGKRNY